jgi:hypothetical protein
MRRHQLTSEQIELAKKLYRDGQLSESCRPRALSPGPSRLGYVARLAALMIALRVSHFIFGTVG